MKRPYRHWVTSELRVIRDHYPAGGVREVLRLLPHRTSHTIRNQAVKIGVRFEKVKYE